MSPWVLWLLALSAEGARLPDYFKVPPGGAVNSVLAEDYGEANILTAKDHPEVKRGRHFYAEISLNGMSEEAPREPVWAAIQSALAAAGWTVAQLDMQPNPPNATLRYQ